MGDWLFFLVFFPSLKNFGPLRACPLNSPVKSEYPFIHRFFFTRSRADFGGEKKIMLFYFSFFFLKKKKFIDAPPHPASQKRRRMRWKGKKRKH